MDKCSEKTTITGAFQNINENCLSSQQQQKSLIQYNNINNNKANESIKLTNNEKAIISDTESFNNNNLSEKNIENNTSLNLDKDNFEKTTEYNEKELKPKEMAVDCDGLNEETPSLPSKSKEIIETNWLMELEPTSLDVDGQKLIEDKEENDEDHDGVEEDLEEPLQYMSTINGLEEVSSTTTDEASTISGDDPAVR